MYQTGLVSVSFRKLSPKEVIEAAASAGLKWIEWGSDVHAPYDNTERLTEITELQKEYGVSCFSYGTYFRIGKTPKEELPHYIRAAKRLGTSILRLWPGVRGSDDYTPEEKEAFYAECKELALVAEKEGVTLCMECHNCTMTDKAESAYQLMQAVNSPAFQMYYQLNPYRTVEENIAYAKLLSPYIQGVHVFHWIGNEKFPLADGFAPWQEYLTCLPDDKTLLLEFMPDDCVESLPTEANTLFKLIETK